MGRSRRERESSELTRVSLEDIFVSELKGILIHFFQTALNFSSINIWLWELDIYKKRYQSAWITKLKEPGIEVDDSVQTSEEPIKSS